MSFNETYEYQKEELNLFYAICEVLVAFVAVIGNALVIYVFRKERRLRRRTNYYIVSLATADLLVGLLGIPFAIMSSVGLPNNLHACLFTVSLLVVLCTISIFCLLAVSIDRYWAILHPMGYSRNVRTKTALVIISICWFAGCVIGFLPLMGWHKDTTSDVNCFFLKVMDYNYLVFLYFGTIITPAVLLAAFYAHIYRVVLKQLRQMVTMNPEKGIRGSSKTGTTSSGGMIRMLGAQQRNEVKATQNLAIIVLFFMVCWIPLYTINCIIAFDKDFKVDPTFMLACIILSHLNSAGNPILYAYHLRDFRAALKNFFCRLFGMPQYCEQVAPRYHLSIQNKARIQHKADSTNTYINSPSSMKNKLITPAKVTSIVRNCEAVAIATTGEVKRDIWNIVEDSGRDSASSNDSLKSVESCHQEKILMLRPATPYRPRTLSGVNQAYLETSSYDSDDVFVEDTEPYNDYNFADTEMETSLSEKIMKTPQLVSKISPPNESPRRRQGLFFIEKEAKKHKKPSKSCSLTESKYKDPAGLCVPDESNKNNFKLNPYKVVSNILKNQRKLNRSLSDGNNYESIIGSNTMCKKDNDIQDHSCGT